MRSSLAVVLALLVGCSSGPPAPTLPHTLTFRRGDYEESGGILPITGTLELVIEPSGGAKSACLRQILTNVERDGDLSREQMVELVSRVDAWAAKPGNLPPGNGKNYAVLVYGDKKTAWQKDDKLPPELEALVSFLLTIPPTLRVQVRRR